MNGLWIVVVGFGLCALLTTVLWAQARSNWKKAAAQVIRENNQKAVFLADIGRLKEELKKRESTITITPKMVVPEEVFAKVDLPVELENSPWVPKEIETRLSELLGKEAYSRAKISREVDYRGNMVVFLARLMIVDE